MTNGHCQCASSWGEGAELNLTNGHCQWCLCLLSHPLAMGLPPRAFELQRFCRQSVLKMARTAALSIAVAALSWSPAAGYGCLDESACARWGALVFLVGHDGAPFRRRDGRLVGDFEAKQRPCLLLHGCKQLVDGSATGQCEEKLFANRLRLTLYTSRSCMPMTPQLLRYTSGCYAQ